MLESTDKLDFIMLLTILFILTALAGFTWLVLELLNQLKKLCALKENENGSKKKIKK